MSSGSNPLSAKEDLVLRHIARYRLTFQEVLSTLYFDGKSPQKLLSGLKSRGFIKTLRAEGFHRKRRAYVLTEQATAQLGVPRSRAGQLEGQALAEQFARLSYCYFTERSCTYVEPREAPFDWKDAFGNNRNLSLMLRRCSGGHVLDLVSLVGERTRKSSCKDRLQSLDGSIKTCDTLRKYSKSGHLQLVLVGQTPARRKQIADWLSKDDWKQVVSVCPVAVVSVPWFDDLEGALKHVVA